VSRDFAAAIEVIGARQLATAIFEWIEAFYNPVWRHSAPDYASPISYERAHAPAAIAA
jgi:putative transposase